MGWGHFPDLEAYLTAGSQEIFRGLQLDEGQDIEFRQSGALQAIHTEAQYALAAERVRGQRGRGLCVELLTTREARGLEPCLNPALPGVLHVPLRAQASPQKATRAFARSAERAGARILIQHEVTAIRAEGASYRVDTSRDAIAAAALVLAAGAWCPPLGAMLGLRIPIVPVRGQMWATSALPPRVFHTIGSVESTLCWQAHPPPDANTPPELTHHGPARITRHL